MMRFRKGHKLSKVYNVAVLFIVTMGAFLYLDLSYSFVYSDEGLRVPMDLKLIGKRAKLETDKEISIQKTQNKLGIKLKGTKNQQVFRSYLTTQDDAVNLGKPQNIYSRNI